ncbi:HERV-H LTR-associating protein 2 isoform X2 [Nycticebus coucang]|uniref:HERV-H LTR-associating protein 2 isoform X2 n=1 Tax=Nycticebus coucang TaxID=9470 RepID=UPI00234D24BD|nr:HERV-H LTR-associating protein 2 isoform X2 [Nycticebus coucang]
MKAQGVLSVFLILIPPLSGFQDAFFLAFLDYMSSANEQVVIGRLDEDIILPCSFKSGSKVIIHWQKQKTINVHSYYRGSDHLENQDSKYTNRTSLFHSEIHNGNASLSLRRLSLLDEGNYNCYVSTAIGSITNKVVLKVGAFLTPVMKYEKRKTNSFLICSVFSVYPRPVITWKVDGSTPVSEKNTGEIGPLGSFYINSTQNITGSNSSYECTIENSLLKQTWMGRWTREGSLHNKQGERVSLSCQLGSNFSLLNQDFRVTWSRVQHGTSFVLASYPSSSQKMIISEPRLSLNKELISQRDFSVNLTDLSLSDSGEYLCNISSSKYTLLTIHTLHIELSQGTASRNRHFGILAALPIFVVLLILAVRYYPVCNSSSTGSFQISIYYRK